VADDLTALLEKIRGRQQLASDASLGFSRMEERHAALIKVAYEDTPLLLAAVEAVLELPGAWEQRAANHKQQAKGLRDNGGILVPAAQEARAQTYRANAQALRETIARELDKEVPSDG
jgi:hypothetical protein